MASVSNPRGRGEGTNWAGFTGVDPYSIQALSNSYMIAPPGAAVDLSPAEFARLKAKYPDMAAWGRAPENLVKGITTRGSVAQSAAATQQAYARALATREAWEQYLGDSTGPARQAKALEAWSGIVAENPAARAAMPNNLFVDPGTGAVQPLREDYVRDPTTGGARHLSFFERNSYAKPLIMSGIAMGGGLVGGYLAGAAGGGGGGGGFGAAAGPWYGGAAGTVAGGAGGGVGGGLAGSLVTPAVIGTGISTAGNLIGTTMAARAQDRATQAQTAAATEAARLEAKSNADMLAFLQQQAQAQWQQSELDRRGNYDQWAARERRLGSILGEWMGLGPREIPAYVPSLDPRYTSGGTPLPTGAGSSASAGALPTIDPKGDLGAQISAYFKGRGVSDQETSYWVGKWPELMARGVEINDPNYAVRRLSQADVFGGGYPSAAPPSSASSAAQAFAPPRTQVRLVTGERPEGTAAYQAPTLSPASTRRYGSIGDYTYGRRGAY